MLHISSKFIHWIRTHLIPRQKHLLVLPIAVFFLLTALIYAVPQSDSAAVSDTGPSTAGIEKLFFSRSAQKNSFGIKITDPTGASSNPEKALSNQFQYANKGKFTSLAPGEKLDFSYEISNTGTEAVDIRETYYILSFDPQDKSYLDFAMFGGFEPMEYAGAYKGTRPLDPHNLYGNGRLYSFTSDPYTLSGSDEMISSAPSSRRSERYMVFNYYANNERQGDTILIIITLEHKLHSDDDWEPSITDTVIVGGSSSSMEYRTDTDVYFSCGIAALDFINPDNPGYVTFTITDQLGDVTTLTYNDFNSPVLGIQRAYVPFHIPDKTGELTVSITSSDNVVCETKEITATIVSSEENTPPDPTLDMVVSAFGILPIFESSQNHEWVTYNASKNAAGEWEYEEQLHTASLNTNFMLTPDSNVKTAVGTTLGSGYGVNAELTSRVSGASTVFDIQNVYCLFPEFYYLTYSRKLDKTAQDLLSATWEFRVNKYSHSNSRAHYIPPAYPDGLYTVFAIVRDAWTPVGELKGTATAEVNVVGSLYDDWYVSQTK